MFFDIEAWMTGKTRRMHTINMIGRETVAEHSWGVAHLLIFYWKNISREAILQALRHDAGEQAVGDIPGNVKWQIPDLMIKVDEIERIRREIFYGPDFILSIQEDLAIRLCDQVDFILTAHHEWRMGNSYAKEYSERSMEKFKQLREEYSTLETTSEDDLNSCDLLARLVEHIDWTQKSGVRL